MALSQQVTYKTKYPYYTFPNKHLPPSVECAFTQKDNSWTWTTNAAEEAVKDKYWGSDTGSWDGYFPWTEQENSSTDRPWPLVSRRGGLSNQEAFRIQTLGYNSLPDLASGTRQRENFFGAVAMQLPLNNLLNYC